MKMMKNLKNNLKNHGNGIYITLNNLNKKKKKEKKDGITMLAKLRRKINCSPIPN